MSIEKLVAGGAELDFDFSGPALQVIETMAEGFQGGVLEEAAVPAGVKPAISISTPTIFSRMPARRT